MAGDFTPPPRIKNALDNRKLALFAPCPAKPEVKSSLMWMLVANNPRMVVWTNDPNDTGKSNGFGKITANLDMPVFVTYLQMLSDIIEHDGEIRQSIDCLNYTFFTGKRSEKPELVSTIWVGKDKDGIIWTSLVAKNRPKIKFTFGNNDFHHYMNGDGSPMAASVVSQLFAKAYVKVMYGVMEHLLVTNFVEPEKKDKPAYGGDKGRSNNSYNNSNDSDDDIPF